MKSIKVKLRDPLELPDGVVKEVEMRRPTVGDLMDYPLDAEASPQTVVPYLAHLCGMNIEDFRQISQRDYVTLVTEVARFQGDGKD